MRMAVNVGSVSVKVMPTMSGFAGEVDKALSGSGSSTGARFGKAFSDSAGKSGGKGFVSKVCGAVSGSAPAFGSAGKSSGKAFSGGVLSRATGFAGSLLTSIGGKLSGVNSLLGSTGEKAGGGMASRMASGFSAKDALLTGAVASIASKVISTAVGSIDAAISRVDTLNNFPKVLQSLGYGADESQASIDTLSDRLSSLPTRLDAAASGVQQLAPSSKSIGQATDRYLAFNDAVLAGGASEDIQANAMTQLTKAVSTNKMEMDTWMSIQQAMPGQLDQVAKHMLGQKATTSTLYQAMKDGKVSVSAFADAVVDLDKNGGDGITAFSEQAVAATGGIKTSLSNAVNAFPKGVAKIIGAIGASNIVGVIDGVKSTVNGAFSAIVGAMGDPSIQAAAAGFASICGDVLGGAVDLAAKAFGGAVDMVSAFSETLLNNDAAASFTGVLAALSGTALAFGDAAWGIVSNLTGWQTPMDAATDLANGLDAVLEGAQPVISAVGDGLRWVADNAADVAPVVGAIGGALLVVKVAGSPIGGLLVRMGGVLLSLAGAGPAAAGGLTAAAAGERAAGAAAGQSVGQVLAFGAAVLMIGGGVALACAGLLALANAAVMIASAGPSAAGGMAAMVGAVALLAVGAAALGPALTAGAVGMVAFGGGVALVGAGVLLASAGLMLFGAALPGISANGSAAAVGVLALGASMLVLGPGAMVAAAGLTLLGAGVAVAAAGVALLAAGTVLLGSGLALVAASVVVASAGIVAMGAAMPMVSSSAPGAAAGLGALAAAALAAAPGLLAATPAMGSFSSACSTASSASAQARSGIDQVKFASQSMATAAKSSFSDFANSARSAASTASNAIMGACRRMSAEVGSLRLTLPRISVGALPHFSMSGSFDAQTGSVPSVHVNWYKTGGVFSSPSVVGVGEAGREAVVPLKPSVLRGIGEGIELERGGDGESVIAWLDRNLPAIIQRYTPVTLERDLDRHIRTVMAGA